MADAVRTYALRSAGSGREALAAVGRRFRTRRVPADPRRETYSDTFEWRVFRDGGTLSVRRGRDAGPWLLWRSRTGPLRHRLRVEAHPAFARDLPPGPFREELASLIEVRRLLPLVEVEIDSRALAVVDERDKTLARVELERCAAREPGATDGRRRLPATLRVLPVRGFGATAAEIAAFLETELDLRPIDTCELTRALAAIGRSPGAPTPPAARPERGARADAATKTILRALLETMRLNEDGLRRDLDSEFLHDYRVAVRRARSVLAQIKHVFPPRTVERLRRELSWIGGLTGRARDLDVHLLELAGYHALLPGNSTEELAPLEALLRERRRAEHAKLVAGLGSARYRRLVRSWSAFLERPVPQRTPLANARRPIEQVAAERIGHAWSSVLAHGRAIDDGSPARRLHRLRIECKKLRYLIELFGCLYDENRLRPVVKALRRLQDLLGEFNDLEFQQRTLERLGQELAGEAPGAPAALLAAGRLAERLAARQGELRAGFGATFRRFDTPKNVRRFERVLGIAAAPPAPTGPA